MFKNIIGSGSWKYQWVVALGFLVSGGASAVTIEVPCDDASCWAIGLDTRVEVVVGQWNKNLGGAAGTTLNSIMTLTESLILSSGILTSWTETILGGVWVWDSGTLEVFGLFGGTFTGAPVGGATISFGPFSADTSQLGDFDDDVDTPDTAQGSVEITITKQLRCNGNNETCPNPFTVVENAVPEPGTLLLLAGGLAGLAGLRRRRYA